jgi:broad-specificity NMP kinase
MTDQIEYVVTSTKAGGKDVGVFTQEYIDQTRAEIVALIATQEYEGVTRVLEMNITDGTLLNITDEILDEAEWDREQDYQGTTDAFDENKAEYMREMQMFHGGFA